MYASVKPRIKVEVYATHYAPFGITHEERLLTWPRRGLYLNVILRRFAEPVLCLLFAIFKKELRPSTFPIMERKVSIVCLVLFEFWEFGGTTQMACPVLVRPGRDSVLEKVVDLP